MSVNGVTNNTSTDYVNTVSQAVKEKTKVETKAESKSTDTEQSGVYYEASKLPTAAELKKQQNAEVVSKLKADMEEKAAQLESLVKKMMEKQGNSYGEATNMWQFLSKGNLTVDSATKKQAQQDISEDGYWGVRQTSDRILDFAQALSGGDPEKMKEMRAAFEKGYKEATKTWGNNLPSISSNTYDAVIEKFDDWEKKHSNTVETVAES